jgi:lysophospholipase L1-like esterase
VILRKILFLAGGVVGTLASLSASLRAEQKITPDPDAVLFIGSSTIDYWDTLAQDFPKFRTVNAGVAGSQYRDLIPRVDSVVVPSQARRVVMYSGDNDLAWFGSVDGVFKNFKTVVESIHAKLPDTRIYVISVKPALIWTRQIHRPQVEQLNRMMSDYAAAHDHVTYVDIFHAMLNEKNKPRPELFRGDQIHLNEAGYALWTSILSNYLN